MGLYTKPLDIVNRALKHLKLPRISSLVANVQGANELAFSYDKVRQFELSRNLWTFATRTAILRAVDNTTFYVSPSPWSNTTAYPAGAIVSWPLGTHWIAKIPTTGQQPAPMTFDTSGHLVWDSYFGPLTAQQWLNPLNTAVLGANNSSITGQISSQPQTSGYNAGELAFLMTGAG